MDNSPDPLTRLEADILNECDISPEGYELFLTGEAFEIQASLNESDKLLKERLSGGTCEWDETDEIPTSRTELDMRIAYTHVLSLLTNATDLANEFGTTSIGMMRQDLQRIMKKATNLHIFLKDYDEGETDS